MGVWGQKAVGTTRKVYRTGMFRGSIAESDRGAEGECGWGRGNQEEGTRKRSYKLSMRVPDCGAGKSVFNPAGVKSNKI